MALTCIIEFLIKLSQVHNGYRIEKKKEGRTRSFLDRLLKNF